jgi:hypothetical protein
MKSVVKLDIEASQDELAELIFDPKASSRWMDDVQRVEPLGGKLGMQGSRYRLVPKDPGPGFVATVVARQPPAKLRLVLDAPRVSIAVSTQLIKLSARRTRLVSEQTFRFNGAFSAVYGFLARRAIRRNHRRHLESLKQVVERNGESASEAQS